MTPAGQPTSGSDPPPNPSPSSPNEPDGIFTANLKGTELANFAGDTVAEVADQAQHGIQRVCASDSLVLGVLAQLPDRRGGQEVKFVQDVAAAAS